MKKILRDKKMTIKQLSEKTGISVNTLYSITKRDSERVDRVILQQIADALDIHILDLLGIGEELDSCHADFSITPDTPENRALAHFLNTAGPKAIYDFLSEEEKEELLTKSGVIPFSDSLEDSEQPQAEAPLKSEIMEQIKSAYGETISDTFSMYVQLDAGDRGEIRGEIKQMLKQEKYLKQKENLA